MTLTDMERITEFEHRFAKAQATDVVDLAWGYALLNSDFPQSHNHNRIVVTASASAADVLGTTDEILGAAGLTHRHLSIIDDELAQRMASELNTKGFEHDAIATMIYGGPPAEPPEHRVQDVALEVLRPALIRDWQAELPDASDDVFAQLADRTGLYPNAADTARLVVFEGDVIASRGDVYLDRDDRIGQFENLVTHADYRGRGYSRSLIRDALHRGEQAACELFFLTADLNDWPIEWYRRLGFNEITRTHHFTLLNS